MLVRDLRENDIAVINQYWQTLSDADVTRMFIDRAKIPTPDFFQQRLQKLLATPIAERDADPLIWDLDGKMVGFTNLNNIVRGDRAEVHLHMVDPTSRKRGLGRQFFLRALELYFERHQLNLIICQPASTNPAPNGMMRALGVPIAKTHTLTPSPLCQEHEVNRYEFKRCPSTFRPDR